MVWSQASAWCQRAKVAVSERIWDMLENFKEVVEALEVTNESVLSRTGSTRCCGC